MSITINLTRLPCSSGCVGNENDFDPHVMIGDGSSLVGGLFADNGDGQGFAVEMDDGGNVGTNRNVSLLFGGAGFPDIGGSFDVDLALTLGETSTTVDLSYLSGSGSFISSVVLDRTQDLSLLLVRDNDIGEQYQVNSVTITTPVLAQLVVVVKTLLTGPQQRGGIGLVEVPNTDLGQILVDYDMSQFFSFEIAIINNSSAPETRVLSDTISKTFKLSAVGEDDSDGAMDGLCDGNCDGAMLDQPADACTVHVVKPLLGVGALLGVETLLVITCDAFAAGDTATLTVWVETKRHRGRDRFNPTTCLELADIDGTPVNEWMTLNPGGKLYASDGTLLEGPAQSIQLQPIPPAGGCKISNG